MNDSPSTPQTPILRALPSLRGMELSRMVELVTAAGHPAFRGKQLFQWVFRHGANSFDDMKNLPKDFRAWLAENTRIGGIPKIATQKPSGDGSVKFLFELHDGLKVESVLMPGSGLDETRMTLCVSSQVGCAVDCKFCVTGKNGFFRHMTPDEIVGQALAARDYLREANDGRVLRNVVFMGMGEPLLNVDNLLPALRILTDAEGMDLSPKRVTVSTSGILPGLQQLADSGIGVGLAISLNGVTQEERERVMPITKRFPITELLDACRRYPLRNNARITFEYVLLSGVNDSIDHAKKIAKMLRGIPSKVNVIPFNPDPALPFERPTEEHTEAFAQVLRDAKYTCSVRWSKALDVSGACGQLAGQYRQKNLDGKYSVLPRE